MDESEQLKRRDLKMGTIVLSVWIVWRRPFGILDAHKGSIEVSSELGKGSTFTVKLPVKE